MKYVIEDRGPVQISGKILTIKMLTTLIVAQT